MRIINIVDNVDKVNFGIWNAAIATCTDLLAMGIVSELWHPTLDGFISPKELPCYAIPNMGIKGAASMEVQRQLDPLNDIIVTHGCWRFPTKWGRYYQQKGYKWVYTPHGMLDPWALKNKRLKKLVYFNLFERPMAKHANATRAVSPTEKNSLKQLLPPQHIAVIPNGVVTQISKVVKADSPITFLFLARLHYKKNILALVQAWQEASLGVGFQLVIAGPDQGALQQIQPILDSNNTISYIGAVYGEAKEQLLKTAHFYILPSLSEGFPTSVLEAMIYGAYPLISTACNLPEAFAAKLAYDTGITLPAITGALQWAAAQTPDTLKKQSEEAAIFVRKHFDIQLIAKQQMELYTSLLAVRR